MTELLRWEDHVASSTTTSVNDVQQTENIRIQQNITCGVEDSMSEFQAYFLMTVFVLWILTEGSWVVCLSGLVPIRSWQPTLHGKQPGN